MHLIILAIISSFLIGAENRSWPRLSISYKRADRIFFFSSRCFAITVTNYDDNKNHNDYSNNNINMGSAVFKRQIRSNGQHSKTSNYAEV